MSETQGGEEVLFKDARSDRAVYTLPTGYLDRETMEVVTEIEIREITGEEEDMLVARGLNPHQRMNNLMVACIVRIGNWTDKAKIRDIVIDLVGNDRFFLVYKIREISLGRLYRFTFPCPHCKDDKIRIVDLGEIKFPGLPDPKKRVYEGILPRSQKSYKWIVLNGKTEERAQKVLKSAGDNVLSAVILQRLQELDGSPASIDNVKALSSVDRNFLRTQFKEVEGEFDNKIDIECPACGENFSLEADAGRQEFFFPTV